MANICPQRPQLNRRYWLSVEKIERDYARQCDTLYVISGEICANTYGLGSLNNSVRIPTHFYKTIVGVGNHKVVVTAAWLFDNTNDKQPEVQHRTTTFVPQAKVPKLEALIGKDLYQGFWFNKTH